VTEDTAIDLVALSKYYGNHLVVDNIDLGIAAGTFFALLGPSGSGKTTTLRMIAGFEKPTAGLIRLAGRDVSNQPAYRRKVNTVFQSYALFPHLDVCANVAFGLRRAGVDRTEARRRVGEILELTELDKLGARKPAQLSGGQQQRVALARALVNKPAALLLDEPLGALDLRLRRQLQQEIKRIQQDVGITFVHVTHDQEEAMSMADEIAVMDDGRILQIGTAAQLYEKPATEFVARFLGYCNLLPGEPFGRPDHQFGVRPENMRFGDPRPGDIAMAGRIVSSVYLGASVKYDVALDRAGSVSVVTPARNGALQPDTGEPVTVTWREADSFRLDA
jgi:ABC-type Fe3+/spermidine/putrescine transport system ATPase subunit